MSSVLRHPLSALVGAVLLTVPWLLFWATGTHQLPATATLTTVGVSGLAVLGASFLLAWGAETAEKDVPRAFALAVLAVLAVAPEYAVDALYAWQAGSQAGTLAGQEAANLAVANMTGANRILIGLGWSGIALFSIWRAGKTEDTAVVEGKSFLTNAVKLDRSIATEILFLTAATVFAFFVPLGGGIDGLDMVVLVGIYVTYIAIIIRGDVGETSAHVGVPSRLQQLPKLLRVLTVLTLFAFSGFLIFTAVEPFAHGLEELGKGIGIPPFFMIQWVAPLASESPELIVVAYLVNKARSTAAFNALISSKLNQWTLLIGTLVVVYSLALGQYGVLPFDRKQAGEIWLTAAQSFFALAVLINFRITVREALAILVLFTSQVLVEFYFIRTAPEFDTFWVLMAYTAVYLVIGLAMFATRIDDIKEVSRITVANIRGTTAAELDRGD
ncbi:cation:H+ antiporter [Halogranum gelatinilyticum]|uniref:Cation:H+ antiporter n=1 Tax=Halogranum gelatinilyticum TaxID=660521 RepID=A0A1G9QL65_9EURY|nr:sodium:calcium antiporter [Halogranum gelatinilyticum]SDM11726.1 cation:H+ antiporter [Halogranum gelatinilyticum]